MLKLTLLIILVNFSPGLSNEQYTTLELSGTEVYFNRLTISGVNIIAHDISNSAITVNNGLVINGGSHCFYDNLGLGAISSIVAAQSSPGEGDISLIDASITFRNNSSGYDGGAIFGTSSLTIQNTGGGSLNFCGNYAFTMGGAIYMSDNISLIDASITFRNNHVVPDSGAITITDNISLIDASITFRSNNVSRFGGANRFGGAIYSRGNLTISGPMTNLKFYDNSLVGDGGAIFADSLTIQNTSGGSLDFCGNQANYANGGAICIQSDISLIDASITFRNNSAGVTGAAISAGLGGSLTIQTSSGSLVFSNNQPNDIYLNSTTITSGSDICPPLFDCSDNSDNKLCNQLIPVHCKEPVMGTSWDISIGAYCTGSGSSNTCCSYNPWNPTCASGEITDCTNQGVNILHTPAPINRLANFKKAWQTCISDNSCNGIQEALLSDPPSSLPYKAWFLMYDLSLSECSSNILNYIVYKKNK